MRNKLILKSKVILNSGSSHKFFWKKRGLICLFRNAKSLSLASTRSHSLFFCGFSVFPRGLCYRVPKLWYKFVREIFSSSSPTSVVILLPQGGWAGFKTCTTGVVESTQTLFWRLICLPVSGTPRMREYMNTSWCASSLVIFPLPFSCFCGFYIFFLASSTLFALCNDLCYLPFLRI